MRPDTGAGTVLMLGLCGLIATVGVGTAALGVLYDTREKAATAAEAAALAAAVATYPPAADGAPDRLAAELAQRNGARLISCWCDVDTSLKTRVVAVTVALTANVPLFGEVAVGRTARAEFEPRVWLGR
ncbi:MAG TPA: pilus assembly protein TadG-related protein [Acidimicrobiia bacterium]|nr:pilus assembly protein TadG-related protein [Acidimicrobiia bacterium]